MFLFVPGKYSPEGSEKDSPEFCHCIYVLDKSHSFQIASVIETYSCLSYHDVFPFKVF